MNEQLKELIGLAAERICEDYGGEVTDFGERQVLASGKEFNVRHRVDKIVFDEENEKFRYYNQSSYHAPFGNDYMPYELFPTEEEEYKILDEFYAWY